MKKFSTLLLAAGLFVSLAGVFSGCTKQGETGPAGTNGTDGTDANETCKQCHAAAVVDRVATEFEVSKHSWGEAAFEEAGNPGCAPCHEQKGFVYVCANNIPSSFTFNSTTGKYVNDYSSVASDAIGEIGCFTCHSSLHTTYGYSDLTSLTTTAPVSMTMLGGAKTINLPADSGKGNLCVKCHQPRPFTCTGPAANDARLLNYDSVKRFPNLVMFDSAAPNANKWVRPSYRMHSHYGAVGAIYAGMGGIEYGDPASYANSPHTTEASCQSCHMAEPMNGIAGGHAFNVRNSKETPLSGSTTWNFNGCNVTGCHANSPISAASTKWTATRAGVKTLLDNLATKINAAGAGHDILHADATSANLWAGVSTGNYDGYLDIYDASANPTGYWRNPYGSGSTNAGKPMFPTIKMVQMGAIINFQLCLREYSLGIHNTQYVTALLNNTIAAMNAAGL